jgi:hypothetical protein
MNVKCPVFSFLNSEIYLCCVKFMEWAGGWISTFTRAWMSLIVLICNGCASYDKCSFHKETQETWHVMFEEVSIRSLPLKIKYSWHLQGPINRLRKIRNRPALFWNVTRCTCILVVVTDVGILTNYQPTQREIPKSQDLAITQRKKPEISRSIRVSRKCL